MSRWLRHMRAPVEPRGSAASRAAAELRLHASTLRLHADERQAAWIVFSSLDLPLVFPREIAKISQEDMRELTQLAAISTSPRALHRRAYADADGWVYLPGDALIDLAQRIARIHRQTLLGRVERAELARIARIERDFDSDHDLAGELAALDLVRRWARRESPPSELDYENDRLRAFIAAAAKELELAGLPRSARTLRSVLE